jgi:hypothetical protein
VKLNLSDLKKRWRTPSALAITVESSRVNVALVRGNSGVVGVIESFSLPFGADAIVADAENAGKELAKQLDAAEIRERRLCRLHSAGLGADDLSRDAGHKRERICVAILSCAPSASFPWRSPICVWRIAPIDYRTAKSGRHSRRFQPRACER